MRWKAAIGAALDDPGVRPVHSGVLAQADREVGPAAPGQRRGQDGGGADRDLDRAAAPAVDSTILADVVATQDTVTQLISAFRRAAREVPGAAEQIAGVCTGHDYSKPGEPKIDWDDPAAKDALVSALVNDANALVDVFKDAQLDGEARPQPVVHDVPL